MKPSKPLILITAFLEGMSVLVIEIAGARALSPYFGASLNVWTAQITASLLFLALGYGVGGFLSRQPADWKLPAVFWLGGLWMALFPLLRAPLLAAGASYFGVALGSFISSSLLFGLPLCCLGAVSPLLISRLNALEEGAGSAAGTLFLVNTLGGLAGGWLTALVLIPQLPLRLALAGSGLVLILIGSFWAFLLRRSLFAAAAAPLAALMLFFMAPKPAHTLILGNGIARIVMSRQSSIGLIQVLEMGDNGRTLLIDGVTQGGMDKATGASLYEFTCYQDFLSHRFHPQAKKALLLGLGSGVLARTLAHRGLEVSVAEIEPRMAEISRQWFGLPASVKVAAMDGRTYLRESKEKFDLIFLDAFAGENPPWYLSTREAFQSMRALLHPSGRLVINTVTWSEGNSAGLAKMEAGLLEAFGEARVFVDSDRTPGKLVNAIVVAGEGLKVQAREDKFNGLVMENMRAKVLGVLERERPAEAGAMPGTDDHSNLDYAEAKLRSEWRRLVLASLGPEVLGN